MRAANDYFIIAGVAACLGGAIAVAAHFTPHTELSGRVTYVIDGDTFILGREQRIRLWGIDAPELSTPEGQLSAAYAAAAFEDRHVTCQPKGTSYHRVVAQCFLADGQDMAELLVRYRFAHDWPRYSGGYYSSTRN